MDSAWRTSSISATAISRCSPAFKPRGEGPFPTLVECHGGAWCLSDRTTERLRHEAMASHGIVSIALDFRSGNEDPYPASVQDINYAVRWTKANARALKTRPDLVGLSGQSSGGHLAMLVAMRPHDQRYSAIPLPAGSPAQDASVRCVIMSWPVINPLSRYRHAKRAASSANPPAWPNSIITRQDSYWGSEAAMAEGNPVLALERGEKLALPPVLYIQGTEDQAHPRPDLDRFVSHYRKAGGQVDLALYKGEAEGFAIRKPSAPASAQAIERIIDFVHKQLQP